MTIEKRFQKTISRYKSVVEILKWLGWWPPLVGLISGLAWTVWAWMERQPPPILVLGVVLLLVAVPYLFLLPRFVDLLTRGAIYRKPDYSVWRYARILHIRQAACLFADVGWVEGGDAPYPEKARIWAHHIAVAVETHKLHPIPIFDGDDSKVVSPVDYETKVALDELRAWAKEEGIEVPFFSYLASNGVPIPPHLFRQRPIAAP